MRILWISTTSTQRREWAFVREHPLISHTSIGMRGVSEGEEGGRGHLGVGICKRHHLISHTSIGMRGMSEGERERRSGRSRRRGKERETFECGHL